MNSPLSGNAFPLPDVGATLDVASDGNAANRVAEGGETPEKRLKETTGEQTKLEMLQSGSSWER